MPAVSGKPQPSDGSTSRRGSWDPLEMSAAEKLAAEWEARHDVAARGRRPGPETVSHYLSHERLVHQRPAAGRATGATASRQARRPPVPDEPPAQVPAQVPAPRTRGLLRRLLTRQH